MPHAIVFLNEEDINSVIIVAGTDLNFVLNDVKEAWEVILKLIAVYYIFDLQYPAAYGLLNLVEQYCLRTSAASSNEAKKRKTKKFKILQDFFVAFDKFRASLWTRPSLSRHLFQEKKAIDVLTWQLSYLTILLCPYNLFICVKTK